MHHHVRDQRHVRGPVSPRQLHVRGTGRLQVKRTLTNLLVASSLLLASLPASAQDTAHAKEAYDRGLAAQARGDFARAAREFALADTLAPSSAALQAALDAAVDGDDAVTGGELLERSKRLTPPVPKTLGQSIDAAKKKLGGRAGRLHVTCPAGATCTATLDGRLFDAKTTTWAPLGPHTLVVQVDGEPHAWGVDMKADETLEFAPARTKTAGPSLPATGLALSATAPPVPSPAYVAPPAPSGPAPTDSGLTPVIFFVGVGVTVLAGAATTYLMLNAKSKHDDFVDGGCGAALNAGCPALKNDGEAAQTSANVGLGVTAVFAVATVVVGAALTRWHGPSSAAPVRGAPRGAAFALVF